MICLSSRAKRAEQELAATSSRMRFYAEESSKHLDRAHEAENIADELREQLARAIEERDEARSQRDASALYASSQEGCAKSWKEASGRERRKADSVAIVLTETEEKLRKANLALDLSRDRREEIGKQLDDLRVLANSAAITAREAADFLSLSSSPGSEARMHAECVYDDLATLDNALNN